jgi:hypothetical protein
MKTSEMIEEYTKIIVKNRHYNESTFNKIMLKYKMRVCISLVIGLGNYLDYLFSIDCDDNDYFINKMLQRYGNGAEFWPEIKNA